MRSRTKERKEKWVQTIRKDAKTAMEKKDKETRDKKKVRIKEGFTQTWSRSEKMTEAIFERSTKRKNFRGYVDEGNKLRRKKSREMRSRTKEVKKKRDKEMIRKRKLRSRKQEIGWNKGIETKRRRRKKTRKKVKKRKWRNEGKKEKKKQKWKEKAKKQEIGKTGDKEERKKVERRGQ